MSNEESSMNDLLLFSQYSWELINNMSQYNRKNIKKNTK